MYLFLLRKALPFTLTFIFGAALSGLVGLLGSSGRQAESVLGTRTYEFGSRCRMRRHHLVAESKPLNILYKPDARWPLGVEPGQEGHGSVWAKVTFGADGKIGAVAPAGSCFVRNGANEPSPVWEAVERAAREIQFTPELVNSVPVTVTKEVEVRFLAD